MYWYEPGKNAIVKNKKTVSHQHSTAVTGVQGITDFVVTLSHYSPSKPTIGLPVLHTLYVLVRAAASSHVGTGVPRCLDGDEPPCEYWCTPNDPLAQRELHYQCTCPYNYNLDPQSQRCQAQPCARAEVKCRNSRLCIQSAYECNGYQDCPDGTDEAPFLPTCEWAVTGTLQVLQVLSEYYCSQSWHTRGMYMRRTKCFSDEPLAVDDTALEHVSWCSSGMW